MAATIDRTLYTGLYRRILAGLLMWLSLSSMTCADDAFAQSLNALSTSKLAEMTTAVDNVATTGKEKALPYLDALLNNQLYFRKADNQLFRVDTRKEPAVIVDLGTNKAQADASADDFKKIIISNPVRKKLRELMARLQLASSDSDLRAHAAREMLGEVSDADLPILEEALAKEKNSEVKSLLQAAITFPKLNSGHNA